MKGSQIGIYNFNGKYQFIKMVKIKTFYIRNLVIINEKFLIF